MSRVVQVEVLIGRIDQAKQEFASRAVAQAPEGPHAAYYHHGVIVGMENVRRDILAMLKEADETAASKENEPRTAQGGPRAYG